MRIVKILTRPQEQASSRRRDSIGIPETQVNVRCPACGCVDNVAWLREQLDSETHVRKDGK